MRLSEDINDNLPRISVSSGSAFRKCALSYRFNKELGGIRGSAAAFGTSCHTAASEISKGLLSNEEQVRTFILSEFKNNIYQCTELSKYEERFLNSPLLQTTIARMLFKKVSELEVAISEKHYQLDVNGKFTIHGYPDGITKDGDVVEYKFSKKSPIAYDYVHQVSVYAGLISKLRHPVKAHIVIFAKQVTPKVNHQVFDISVKQQKKAFEIEIDTLKAIEADICYPNRSFNNIMCSYCSYRSVCTKLLGGLYG